MDDHSMLQILTTGWKRVPDEGHNKPRQDGQTAVDQHSVVGKQPKRATSRLCRTRQERKPKRGQGLRTSSTTGLREHLYEDVHNGGLGRQPKARQWR
eukprot:5462886-Pyramimonas_sp.AAC.1